MNIERVPKVYFKDRNGKRLVRYIQAYNLTYKFVYDGEDIVLIED